MLVILLDYCKYTNPLNKFANLALLIIEQTKSYCSSFYAKTLF